MDKKVTIPVCFILLTAFILQCNAQRTRECIVEASEQDVKAAKADRDKTIAMATQRAARQAQNPTCELLQVGPISVTDIRDIDGTDVLCSASVNIHLCANHCPTFELYHLVLNIEFCQCCKALTTQSVTVEWSCPVKLGCDPIIDTETYDAPETCGCERCTGQVVKPIAKVE